MRWRKLGLVFCPSGTKSWMLSHAAVPIAEHLEGDNFKILFSSRDRGNRSYTSYIKINITLPAHVLEVSESPVLMPGRVGAFDDSGSMATWLVKHNEHKKLYYIGWNLGVTVPFRNSIGLAIESGDGLYKKCYEGPIIDRNKMEPHFCASCCVLQGKTKWRIWYLSCTGWELVDGKPVHRYHIKYAESCDGIDWDRKGTVAIDFVNNKEYAISRPSVVRDNDCWKMWYSFRGHAYKIGYAESLNGINWSRKDHLVGIDASQTGWDSEMICYPFVFDHKGQRYMLYNGNGYGKTGFGLAILEQD